MKEGRIMQDLARTAVSRSNYDKKMNIWVTILTCAHFAMKEVYEILRVKRTVPKGPSHV